MASAVKRGDIVTVSAPRDYGKPRPAVVIQSDKLRSTTTKRTAAERTQQGLQDEAFPVERHLAITVS